MSLSPSSNWINSRKHDPRPNALHATQTQNGRESSSQRSSPYLSFNNSSNLNEHTSTNTPRSNRIKQNILQKMVDGYRWFFAVRTGREEADVRRNFSKETTFLSWRSVFTAVHHPWPWIILCSVLTVRRKKETTDLRTIRIAISTRPSPLPPLSPSSPNTINPPVYTMNRQLLKVEIRLAKICRRRDVSISRDKTTAAVAFLSEKRKKWKMYTNPRGFRDLGDGEIFRNVATTFIIIVVRRVLEVGVG